MLKKLCLAAGLVASILFAGCASTGGTTPVLPAITVTPAQIGAAFCPALKNSVQLISAFNAAEGSTLPATAKANAVITTTVNPIVNGVCASVGTMTSTDVQTIIQQGLPAVAGIVAALPLPPITQAEIQAGFVAAELATNLASQYESALANAQAAVAPAPASGVSAASAVSVTAPTTVSAAAVAKFIKGQ